MNRGTFVRFHGDLVDPVRLIAICHRMTAKCRVEVRQRTIVSCYGYDSRMTERAPIIKLRLPTNESLGRCSLGPGAGLGPCASTRASPTAACVTICDRPTRDLSRPRPANVDSINETEISSRATWGTRPGGRCPVRRWRHVREGEGVRDNQFRLGLSCGSPEVPTTGSSPVKCRTRTQLHISASCGSDPCGRRFRFASADATVAPTTPPANESARSPMVS